MSETATVAVEDGRPEPAPVTPNYMSYSRMNSILTCGEQFRLERILKVPATEHWASIGGNAFHECVDRILKQELPSFTEDAI